MTIADNDRGEHAPFPERVQDWSPGKASSDSSRRTRRILILDFDLFKNVGGGQTAYRRIIGRDTCSHYYYLTRNEASESPRPANVRTVPFREFYGSNLRDLPAEMGHFYREYVDSWNVAHSVREAVGAFHFDVVDIPDYCDKGLFIRGALAQHGVAISTVAIAMHGTLEAPFREWWPLPSKFSRRLAELHARVHMQYRAADVRYGLSSAYVRKWAHRTGIRANEIDPLTISGPIAPVMAAKTGEKPSVVFVGRLERGKGPDIFVDVVWCLRADSVEAIRLIGAEDIGPSGVSSNHVLKEMAARRGLSLDIAGSHSQEQLSAVFERRTIVVVTSRHDTFNLVALEALRLGCPILVTRRAGVAEWILSTYPELSHLVVDFECSRSAADAIREAVENYDAVRARLVKMLQKRPLQPDFDSLDHAYDGPYVSDPKATQALADIQSRFDSFNRPIPIGASVPAPLDLRLAAAPLAASNALEDAARSFGTRSLLQAIRRDRTGAPEPKAPKSTSRKRRLGESVELLRMSGLFDEVFYLTSNLDVAESGADPIHHYIECGANELRDPNPLFDTAWYLSEYPDVAEFGANPLIHYLTSGAAEGRDPNPLFHSRWYLDRYRDVAAGSNPLRHYLEYGNAELCDPNPLFDSRWYLRQYPTLVDDGINLLHHFQLIGVAEGAEPHPLFKTKWYCRNNSDAIGSGNPLTHFLTRGGVEGRAPHPLFDARWYLESQSDVARAGDNPLIHYLVHGGFEGRDPHPDFDSDDYLSAHPEASAARINPLVHFVYRLADATLPSSPEGESGGTAQDASALSAGAAQWMPQASELEQIRHRLLQQAERTHAEIAQKLREASSKLGEVKIGRAALFRDMARLARKSGSDLIAATYCLRLMRWLGRDHYGDLPFVIDALKRHDYSAEAEAAAAMYEDPAEADVRCRAILDRQAELHRSKPDLPLAVFDDRRKGTDPAVSVIVSLYNAEAKLPTLLANLAMQSLAKHRKLEIVLIDSNSPTNERRVFEEFVAKHDIPIAYARSEKRETIQAAWNRGIKIARAPYLNFLGADEGIHPDCLEILAATLDARPDVDWVIADSLITEVNRHGHYIADVMAYDRNGYCQQLVQLETCYLNWVGGLYRKSIHMRFGYYDETFRGAGDTEFKLRLLRHIKTLHVPKLLGIFNNYPDDRTTQSPMAELEDLRAWYLHRTKAGIGYSYDSKPVEAVQDLFRLCLGYRKSYCNHVSTDFDMAAAVADYLYARSDQDDFARDAAESAHRLLIAIRSIEMLDYCAPPEQRAMAMNNIMRLAKPLQALDAGTFALERKPVYGFFNDNRFEQHWWPW